ncbi:MAG: hypothetical protein ABJQ23_01000 [Shimia thalassica]|uniref:hypothetical protein n=1 Tax=Shimia thalassica TaxID=1715693 RepID=UPI0032991B5C
MISRGALEKMGFYAVADNLYRIELDHYVIDFLQNSSSHLTVCFEHMGRPEAIPDRNRLGWGHTLLERKTNHSGLMIKPDYSNWYRQHGLFEFLKSLGEVSFFASFDRVMTYGGSMGGYGAIAFADVCQADIVLSMNPQATLNTEIASWEPRFKGGKAEDWSGPLCLASEGCKNAAEVYLVFDRRFDLDRKHIELLDIPYANELNIPYVGHFIPRHLKNMGFLGDLYYSIAEGEYDPVSWRRNFRKRRFLADYRENLLKKTSKSRRKQLTDVFSNLQLSETKEKVEMERKEKRIIARALGYGAWASKFKNDNPDATDDEMKMAWDQDREDETTAALRGLASLERAGYKVVPAS